MDCRTRKDAKRSEQHSGISQTIGFIGLWLLAMLSPAYSAEQALDESENAELPDLEFLEFLGSFETDEGEWIDPGSLLAEEFSTLFNAAVAADTNSTDTSTTNGNSGNNNGN